MKKQAFTLVELIVVITILSILGTIAFISLQGYSAQSRDSVRITDLGSMKKTLELYKLKESFYPIPSETKFNVSYSGAIIWTQGLFAESVLKDLKGKLSKAPVDPLTETEYTYSLLNTKKEYELGALFEGEISKLKSIEVNAAGDKIGKSYITGNYNGSLAKAQNGSTIYILAVPTLINGNPNITDYEQIVSNNTLVFKGSNNLPSSYSTTNYNTTAGSGGTTIVNNALVYQTNNISDLTDSGNDTNRITMLNNLQSAYSGTQVATLPNVENVLSASASDDNFASIIVNENLGGNLEVTYNTSNNEENNSGSGTCVFGTSTFGNCTF